MHDKEEDKMNSMFKGGAVALVAVASLTFSSQLSLAKELVKAQTASPGSGAYVATVAFDKVATAHTDYQLQINASQTLTKSMIGLAEGKIMIAPMPVAAVGHMQNKRAMYSKMDNAAELAANLRSVFSYEAGIYHFLAQGDLGLKTLADVKGKKIYLGPPSGAASATSVRILKAGLGYEDGADYEGVKLGWPQGGQAFADGQVDVYARPAPTGSSIVQQFGSNRTFTLLGLSQEQVDQAGGKLALKGQNVAVIPRGTYSGQTNSNEDVLGLAFWHVMGASASADEQMIYDMTKAMWENMDEFYAVAPVLRSVTKDTVFSQMIAPLHAGAYRYYKEAGFDIPANLVPADGK